MPLRASQAFNQLGIGGTAMSALSAKGHELINRNILLVFCIGNFISFLDRVNVSYAALEMNKAIGLDPAMYGFGAGLFFIAYALFEVPANYFLVRLGGPRWFAIIMISWGLSAAAMSLVAGPTSFYLLRLLLGVCEAGFAPGAYYYFTHWFPKSQLGRVNAAWVFATIVAMIVAGPLAASLLKFDAFGVAGWRWMFLVEAIPAVALGVYIYLRLPRGPESASWLSADDRSTLRAITGDVEAHDVNIDGFWKAFGFAHVWLYAACYFFYLQVAFGFSLWLPQVLKSQFAGLSSVKVSLVAMVPWVCAALGTILIGRHSDRTGDRRWHLVLVAFWVGSFLIAGVLTSGMLSFFMTCLAAFGLLSFVALFIAVPMGQLKGTGAASGIAIIVAAGGLGGFIGPYVFGLLRSHTGSFNAGIVFFGCMAMVAGLVPLLLPKSFPPLETPKHLPMAD
jgi:ACS family tartrate transporter-like MFS transporter